MTLQNIAVLIDADNASAKTIGAVLQEIEKFGKIRTKKVYGDWALPNLASWQEAILRHAIDSMQQFSYVKGKNATDIALVIDAMDMLHSGEFDGFCLVSSDSDFASLAVRIRKNKIPVYGFGKNSAVSSFKQACDKFIVVENLLQNTETTEATEATTVKKWDNKKLKQDTKLMNALRDCVTKNLNANNEWARYPTLSLQFKKKYPDLTPEKYGFEKLIHIYREIDIFEVKYEKEEGSDYQTPFIKLKNNKLATTTPNSRYTTQQLQAETDLINTIIKLIDENPKSENGWASISYIASQLNQNPNIDTKKYGYAKFSELITNIRLFDFKKINNHLFIKFKNNQNTKPKTEQTTTTAQTATLESQAQTPLVINNQAHITIKTPENIDVVLWRLTANNKVRGDEDMIFYGQTYSPDDSVQLEIGNDNQYIFSEFDCQFTNQPHEINRIIFTLSHENELLPLNSPIQMTISQNMQRLFDAEIKLETTAKSMFLFELVKTQAGWQFRQRQQLINADLKMLCTKLGVEVSDE